MENLSVQELNAYYDLTAKLLDFYARQLKTTKESTPLYSATAKKFNRLAKQTDKIRAEVENRIDKLLAE
ncbi:MAG: hypothetical protein LUD72_01505 [Bacteroidales bacterium]|nr:hypothetical protein [Bacteroidales bacterium]